MRIVIGRYNWIKFMLRSDSSATEKTDVPASKVNSAPTIHIVLDIDETITNALNKKDELRLRFVCHELNKIDVMIGNPPDSYIMPHLLHPGVIEFIQFLFSIPNVIISFFSAGLKERNTRFVSQLLISALGTPVYEAKKDNVTILSREDLINLNGYPRKDLSIFTEDTKFKNTFLNKTTFANTILIDDIEENVIPPQLRNYIKIPSLNVDHIQLSDPEGFVSDE